MSKVLCVSCGKPLTVMTVHRYCPRCAELAARLFEVSQERLSGKPCYEQPTLH